MGSAMGTVVECYDCQRCIYVTGKEEYGFSSVKNLTELRAIGWSRDYLSRWHCHDCKDKAKERRNR